MVRGALIVLGIGLAMLWLAGLGSPFVPGWLAWADGLMALFSFGAAATGGVDGDIRADKAMLLSVFLAVFWAISFASPNAGWLRWFTFAFSIAYFAVGAYGESVQARERRAHELTKAIDEDHRRKAA